MTCIKLRFRCKSTSNYTHAQIIMLQNMPLMFLCNKWIIFCNKISIYKCFILARTRQVSKVFLIAFGEIARAGKA